MLLIGENIHIISKPMREAVERRDEGFIRSLVSADMDYTDLNVGPGKIPGALEWLVKVVKERICFDTTNADEMARGLAAVRAPQDCFINSTGKAEPRFTQMTDLALKYGCNLIALTLEDSIPKTADGRLEVAFEIYEKCMCAGLPAHKIFFDPLVLPLSVDQSQALEVLNTIKMLKESFDPPVNTIIGLSNISNGAPAALRPHLNRAFAMLAIEAGVDAMIVDAKDSELVRLCRAPEKPNENLVRILLNEELYSPSMLAGKYSLP
jgi:5-methyltetrahydrofolate corrinoid/iron sulfur protein methyltransferase